MLIGDDVGEFAVGICDTIGESEGLSRDVGCDVGDLVRIQSADKIIVFPIAINAKYENIAPNNEPNKRSLI